MDETGLPEEDEGGDEGNRQRGDAKEARANAMLGPPANPPPHQPPNGQRGEQDGPKRETARPKGVDAVGGEGKESACEGVKEKRGEEEGVSHGGNLLSGDVTAAVAFGVGVDVVVAQVVAHGVAAPEGLDGG